MQDQMQAQRFERKYIITPEQIDKVREFIRAYMELDEFSKIQDDRYYPVHSLYLDNSHLTTYWATIKCEKTRFKLRVRYYDELPDSPVFFEIKRRVGECILKQRGAVRRSAAQSILGGNMPSPADLISKSAKHLVALQTFCLLMHKLGASPRMHIAYLREAWTSPGNNSLRITFDKQVCGSECRNPTFSTKQHDPVSPFGDRIVLELKYTNRFPEWLSVMVRQLNLLQCGAAKYCGSITEMNLQGAAPG